MNPFGFLFILMQSAPVALSTRIVGNDQRMTRLPTGPPNREAQMSSSRRGRLRLRYGYALAVVIALGLIGGTIAVVQNHGRVPDANTTSIGQAR
jgi:hypothetical protein